MFILHTENENIVCTPCTAIALCDNENEAMRQDAVLVTNMDLRLGECNEFIVFCDWKVPETEEDYDDMCEDSSAWDTLQDYHHIIRCVSPDEYYADITQTR